MVSYAIYDGFIKINQLNHTTGTHTKDNCMSPFINKYIFPGSHIPKFFFIQ